MTIDVYPLVISFGLAFLTMVGCMAMLVGWFFWAESKLRRSRATDERRRQALRLTAPGAWGEPDLTPPSTSAAARTEIDQLEELWRLPVRPRPLRPH